MYHTNKNIKSPDGNYINFSELLFMVCGAFLESKANQNMYIKVIDVSYRITKNKSFVFMVKFSNLTLRELFDGKEFFMLDKQYTYREIIDICDKIAGLVRQKVDVNNVFEPSSSQQQSLI